MVVALLLLAVLLLGVGLRVYFSELETEATRQRLRASMEDEDIPIQVSLWRDASNLLQIDRARELVERSPLARVLERRLRQSSLQITLTNALLIGMLPVGLAAGVTQVSTGRPDYALLGSLTMPLLLWFGLKKYAQMRTEKLESQLPALLNQMITTLRSGGTPAAALRLASANVSAPLGPSIARLLESINLGIHPSRAWREWAALWQSKSCDLLAMGIRLKWEAGGEMTSMLEVVLSQLEARRQRELRIRTLTAMARLSTYVLIFLPIAMFLYSWYVNPRVIEELTTNPVGVQALWYTAGLLVIGFFWMRKIARLGT